DVAVIANDGASLPFRIGVWSPWTGIGQFVDFGPSPQNSITAITVATGASGPSPVGGEVATSRIVGQYQLMGTYRIDIVINRAAGLITISVTPGGGASMASSMSAHDYPTMFDSTPVSVTASEDAGEGTSHISLS